MTVENLASALSLETHNGSNLDRKVTGCYIGDLLSWVMGRAKAGDAWITVMGNVNAVAVARLADISCIVLCDGSPMDEAALEAARKSEIPVLRGHKPAYELAVALSGLI